MHKIKAQGGKTIFRQGNHVEGCCVCVRACVVCMRVCVCVCVCVG